MQVGDTIELVRCDDPYTRLQPGARGKISGFGRVPGALTGGGRDERQVHVRWEDGSTLSLLEGVDSFRVVA